MRVGVGVSCEKLSWQAGLQAATAAVTRSGQAKLAIVLATSHYDCTAVLAGARSALGKSQLVGASCAGFFSEQGIFEQGIAVLTLAGEELSVSTALIEDKNVDAGIVGQRIGETLLAADGSDGAVICFADSFEGQGTQLLDALYDTVGPNFSYFGGGAGNSRDLSTSWQMTERGLVSQGISASLLRGCRLSGGVGHGWVPSGSPLVITRAEGRVVYELDGRAALDVYAERLGGIAVDSFAETFMRHPLGICYGPDRFIVRDPLQVVQDTSLQFISDVPSQAVAYIMKPEADPTFSIASGLAQQALAELEKPRFALISYCISRLTQLGSGYQDEIRSLVGPFAGQVPFLGFLASGEIGAYADVPQFHNKSISLLMGGE
jgi:hypothetical protein